jgi:hypothetical protein
MKKQTVVLACIAALVILGIPYAVFASFNGSVVMKAVTTRAAKAYAAEQYPDLGLSVSNAIYDFKSNVYCYHAQSPSSEDTHFEIFRTRDGEMRDDYAVSVADGSNTISRLSEEMNADMEAVLLPVYPHRTRLAMCDFYYGEEFDQSKFKTDMALNWSDLPHPAELTLWVETSGDTPTWEEEEALLREAAALTEQCGMDIRYYSILLECKYEEGEDGKRKPVEYNSDVSALDVPRDVITGDGLADFLAQEKAARAQEKLDATAESKDNAPDSSQPPEPADS